MTVLEDVEKLVLDLTPTPICDDCITERLGLSVRQHANHKTRELARLEAYDRRKADCGICRRSKLVIRHA